MRKKKKKRVREATVAMGKINPKQKKKQLSHLNNGSFIASKRKNKPKQWRMQSSAAIEARVQGKDERKRERHSEREGRPEDVCVSDPNEKLEFEMGTMRHTQGTQRSHGSLLHHAVLTVLLSLPLSLCGVISRMGE